MEDLNTITSEEIQTTSINDELLKESEERAKLWENKYTYLAADFDNYKRNTLKKIADNEKFKNKDIIMKFLDVVDNFERSFKFDDSYLPIYNQLMKILNDEGVEIINVQLGDKFDDTMMNAISIIHDENVSEGCISAIIKNGYRYKGEIIRFIDVIVSMG